MVYTMDKMSVKDSMFGFLNRDENEVKMNIVKSVIAL